MSGHAKNFYKKISSLKDLKTAIREVKKTLTAKEPSECVKITKTDEQSESSKRDGKLKYLGRKKLINGILSHLIGTGGLNDNSYQMDVHLEKYNKGMPCVMLMLVSPRGEILDHSSKYYKDMKEAIKAIVSHSIKKAWE